MYAAQPWVDSRVSEDVLERGGTLDRHSPNLPCHAHLCLATSSLTAY